jgi:GNAT superfamily N-acetyltransferase
MPAHPATIDDIPEVLRLAALMYATIGQRADEDWFREAGRLLETRMGEGRTGVFVADAEEPGRLASCVAATIVERLPGPRNPAATKAAYVQWMCTDPAYRRRGLGRAVLAALLDWLWAHGVSCVELHATSEGDPLYRSFGFEDPAQPQLRLFGPPPSPPRRPAR